MEYIAALAKAKSLPAGFHEDRYYQYVLRMTGIAPCLNLNLRLGDRFTGKITSLRRITRRRRSLVCVRCVKSVARNMNACTISCTHFRSAKSETGAVGIQQGPSP